jgi:hypothetical protein
MSEPKFTPGPWRVGAWSGRCHKPSHQGISHPGPRGADPCVYTPEFVEGLYGIAAENGVHVVSVSCDELVMTEDDAWLMAAAPDLLAALQLCYDHCRLYHREVEINNVGEAVRAALAKAGAAP